MGIRVDPVEFKRQLERRTKDFAVAVFLFLNRLPSGISNQVISYQLGKSASSIGANYREANRAESRDDFIHKLRIALKEASETGYWLEVLADIYPSQDIIEKLKQESVELRNLLQAICKSASSKTPKSPNINHKS